MGEKFSFAGRKGTRVLAFEVGLFQGVESFKTDDEGVVFPVDSAEDTEHYSDFEVTNLLGTGPFSNQQGGFVSDEHVLLGKIADEMVSPDEVVSPDETVAPPQEVPSPATETPLEKQEPAVDQAKLEEMLAKKEEEIRKSFEKDREESYKKGFEEAEKKHVGNTQEELETIKAILGKINQQSVTALEEQKKAVLYFVNSMIKRFFTYYAQNTQQQEIIQFVEQKISQLQVDTPIQVRVHPSANKVVTDYLNQKALEGATLPFSVIEDADLGLLDVGMSWWEGGAEKMLSTLWAEVEDFCQKHYGDGPWAASIDRLPNSSQVSENEKEVVEEVIKPS